MPPLDIRKNDDAKRVQQRLIGLGFLFGFADGTWGPRSRKALQDFRFSHGLSDTDIWDEQAQSMLPASASASVIVSLVVLLHAVM